MKHLTWNEPTDVDIFQPKVPVRVGLVVSDGDNQDCVEHPMSYAPVNEKSKLEKMDETVSDKGYYKIMAADNSHNANFVNCALKCRDWLEWDDNFTYDNICKYRPHTIVYSVKHILT